MRKLLNPAFRKCTVCPTFYRKRQYAEHSTTAYHKEHMKPRLKRKPRRR